MFDRVMGTKGTVLLLVAALVLLVAGCGSSDEPLSPRAANEALITTNDLSGKGEVTTEESAATEPCGPMPIFKENEAKTAITQLFGIGKQSFGVERPIRLKEAVGAFEDEENAEAAYDTLTAQKRIDCIRKSSENSSTVQDPVEVSEPKSFGVGDEDALVRFKEIDPQNPLPYVLDVMAIRSGRCVGSIVFIFAERNPTSDEARAVGEAAAKRFETACEPE
jgi:hypothetical protein